MNIVGELLVASGTIEGWRRLLQIQMEYWSFITNGDVQVYQSMWIVHNPLMDIKCAFDITGDEK